MSFCPRVKEIIAKMIKTLFESGFTKLFGCLRGKRNLKVEETVGETGSSFPKS